MKKQSIYYIGGPLGGIAEYKVNARLKDDGSISGIYYSAIANAAAATVYFTDRRTAKNCLRKMGLEETFKPNWVGSPAEVSRVRKVVRLHRDDLHEVKRGYYISKNTDMYRKVAK